MKNYLNMAFPYDWFLNLRIAKYIITIIIYVILPHKLFAQLEFSNVITAGNEYIHISQDSSIYVIDSSADKYCCQTVWLKNWMISDKDGNPISYRNNLGEYYLYDKKIDIINYNTQINNFIARSSDYKYTYLIIVIYNKKITYYDVHCYCISNDSSHEVTDLVLLEKIPYINKSVFGNIGVCTIPHTDGKRMWIFLNEVQNTSYSFLIDGNKLIDTKQNNDCVNKHFVDMAVCPNSGKIFYISERALFYIDFNQTTGSIKKKRIS